VPHIFSQTILQGLCSKNCRKRSYDLAAGLFTVTLVYYSLY
jgi:hypothetical protein